MPIIYKSQHASRYLNALDQAKLAKYGGAFSQGPQIVLGAKLNSRLNSKHQEQLQQQLEEDTNKAVSEILSVTGDGFVEDAARAGTHAIIDAIPIVGQLIPNSWIDKACDWIGDNVWNPIKNFFSGKGLNEEEISREKEKFLITNEKRIGELAKKLLEEDITTGTGIIPSYISKLRSGDKEQKQLANKLVSNLSKPKFNRFVKDLPKNASIVEALKAYKGRNKKPVFQARPRTKEDIIGSGFKWI